MSRKAPVSKQSTRLQKDAAECDRLLNEIHDMLDGNPSLERLRAITPPRPGTKIAAAEAPPAAEFIATREMELTAEGASALPPCEANSSPGSQVSASDGDLIGPTGTSASDPRDSEPLPQVITMEQVAPRPSAGSPTTVTAENARLSHHGATEPGE